MNTTSLQNFVSDEGLIFSSMSNISDHVPLFLDVEWHSPKNH